MDRATRKRLFNLCNPEEPLAPDDPRNVDVDAMPGAPRGQRWVEVLAGPMELAEKSFTLVTAQRGAGLTTERRRLAARLRETDGANLLVVEIDAEEVLDVHGMLDVPDLLPAVMERVTAAVLVAEGKASGPGWAKAIWGWIEDPTGLGPGTEPQPTPGVRQRARADAAAELSRFVKDARNEMVLLNGRARRAGYEGIAVLFDSLTHVQGDSSTWGAVLAGAERLFGTNASYLELPIHLLYTVPVPLVLRLSAPVHFLPQIATPEASREIVRRRVHDDALLELLGGRPRDEYTAPGSLFEAIRNLTPRLKPLLEGSAGNPAAIVRLLRECVTAGSVDDRRLDQILSLDADGLRRTTPSSAYPWLARVQVEGSLSFADSSRAEAERLLASSAVVRYQDGEVRHRMHPSFLKVPGVAAEVERLSHERGTVEQPDGRR